MSANTCHPDQLSHVITAAMGELQDLLEQRKAIENQVRVARRTLKGLAIVFGRSEPQITAGNSPKLSYGNAAAAEERNSNRLQGRAQSQAKVTEEQRKFKLERACRLALLESDIAATAGEVYDRIMRRNSYRLNLQKRPLKAVLAALQRLVETREVELSVRGDVKTWSWLGNVVIGEPETHRTFPSPPTS